MSRMDDYLARAEDEWNSMTLREKVAQVDPEGDMDLFLNYANRFSGRKDEQGRMTHVAEENQAHTWLDELFKDQWMHEHAMDTIANEADDAYARAEDR